MSHMYLCVNVCYGRKNGGGYLRRRWIFGSFCTLEFTGLTICLNPSLLEHLVLYETGHRDLGWSNRNKKRWWKLAVPCVKCQRHVTNKSGIICANYEYSRGPSQSCQWAWCTDCFVPHELDSFEVALPRDFNGASLAEVEDEIRFKTARPGDYICCMFQCPNC